MRIYKPRLYSLEHCNLGTKWIIGDPLLNQSVQLTDSSKGLFQRILFSHQRVKLSCAPFRIPL